MFESVGEYRKAREHHEKALALSKSTGNRNGEGAHQGNLGTVFLSLADYDRAKHHFDKALAVHKEIGNRGGEASSYGGLGNVYS